MKLQDPVYKRWPRVVLAFVQRPYVYPLLIGIVVGPGVGIIAYLVSTAPARDTFVYIGAAIGLAIGAAIAIANLRHSDFVVHEAKVTIPPSLTEVTFSLNREHRVVAWKIFVEITTRISTQPLPPHHGTLKAAIASLYALFATTRTLVRDMSPPRLVKGDQVELYAIKMLNEEFRPFLGKWHPLLEAHLAAGKSEVEWSEAEVCRSELESLRLRLIPYIRNFGSIAGVHDLDKFMPTGLPGA